MKVKFEVKVEIDDVQVAIKEITVINTDKDVILAALKAAMEKIYNNGLQNIDVIFAEYEE